MFDEYDLASRLKSGDDPDPKWVRTPSPSMLALPYLMLVGLLAGLPRPLKIAVCAFLAAWGIGVVAVIAVIVHFLIKLW